MPQPSEPLDFRRLRVYPLAERRSLAKLDEILIDPSATPEPCDEVVESAIARCAAQIKAARERGASVMLIYGAHLIKNGAAALLGRLIDGGWVTHLATNGAGTIHDWEFAWFGKSTESVADGVGRGCFGTWDETGRNIHLALLAGGIRGEGYGRSLGRFISDDGIALPAVDDLRRDLRENPDHPLTPARADLLRAMLEHNLKHGRHAIEHPYKHGSALSQAFQKGVPVTVHPGIGYDIIANHPMFNGAVIGRAADVDFRVFGAAVEGLDGGVVLSIGSAIMGPQVFEKSLSCVNNLRLQTGRPIVSGHSITVVDLQDGGNWDWTQGEPPKTNPAYYLRFCKSYSRMGGEMHYVQADNAQFTLRLCRALA